jgi:drug/metabolite transporter (DMT)-like permease
VVLATESWRDGLPAGELDGAVGVFAGSVAYGVAFAYARRFVSGRSAPLALASIQLAMASVMAIPLVLALGGLTGFDLPTALVILLLGPIGTGVAYVMFHGLVRDLGAARASTVSYLPSVVAVAIGVGGLGEPLRPALLGGVAAVLVGLAMARRRCRSAN